MQNTDALNTAVRTFLKSHHMLAYDDWIKGCVDYFKDNINNVKEMQTIAYEQWLLHDLQDICPGSLPTNLRTTQKTVLNGRYVLQINEAMDISIPAYQQYLKLKKADTENITATMNPEEKISSKRMLKFNMTDGKQTISGIEYETISKLMGDIKPGCKILVTGPVQCRQGLLLLIDKAVEFLDGEVSDIEESHSLAAQLATKLGLPIIKDVSPTAETVITSDTATITTSSSHRNDERNRPIDLPQLRQANIPNQQQLVNQNPLTNDRLENDDIFDDADLNDIPLEGFGKRQLDMENKAENSQKRLKVDTAVVNTDYPDDDELAELMDEDEEHLREIESLIEQQFQNSIEETNSGPIELAAEPFVYIKQINEMSENAKTGKKFHVKAQILTVLTRLTLTNEWSLKCRLTDGTGCIDVEFAGDILSGFLGFTPQDINELKKKVATNPCIKDQVNLAYQKTRKTLETLYGIMELTMYTLPKITRVIDFEQCHVDLLKRRLHTSGL